jgi:alpha-L-fucosidase 2
MRGLVVVVALVLTVPAGSATQPAPATATNVLWYRAPAADWNEALPIGSGRLGAMVFGGVTDERLQLNEDTVWAGEKRDRINPAGRSAIPEIRQLLAKGRAVEAEAHAAPDAPVSDTRRPDHQADHDR